MKTPIRSMRLPLAVAGFLLATVCQSGDRLLATGGAQQVEGAGGGGVVPWALIAGYGTSAQVGGSAFYTYVDTQDFKLDAYGLAVGVFDRLEVSFAKQQFDASSVVPGLKLKMDIFGAKLKVFGDAVYDQDTPWPQVSVGLQHKRNTEMAIPTAIGARSGSDTDFYLAATKIWLAGFMGRNVLGNVALRATRANQMGLLGFGGDRKNSRSVQPEVSAAVLLTDNLALGADYRRKPDNLSAFKEEDFSDVFLAWFPHRHVAVTAAWARLGTIAGKPKQDGAYISIQLTH